MSHLYVASSSNPTDKSILPRFIDTNAPSMEVQRHNRVQRKIKRRKVRIHAGGTAQEAHSKIQNFLKSSPGDKKGVWFHYSYETIPHFCFDFGRLVHVDGKCDPPNDPLSQWGE